MLFVMTPKTSDDFGEFWQAYPRKVGKLEAQRAWTKAKKHGVTVEAVLAALAWQTQSDQWTRGYVPHPSTYLNQGRWLDEPPASVTVAISERERRNAEEVRRKAFGRCPHDPPCGSYAACVTAIAVEQRVDPMKARA